MSAGRPEALEGVLETVLYHEPAEAAEMLHLYRDVLGLEVVVESERVTALRVGSGVLLLFDRVRLAEREGPIADHGTTGSSHVALLAPADQYENWREVVGEAGFEPTHEERWSEGRRSFYFRDPAGNLIEIADGDIWPPAPEGATA